MRSCVHIIPHILSIFVGVYENRVSQELTAPQIFGLSLPPKCSDDKNVPLYTDYSTWVLKLRSVFNGSQSSYLPNPLANLH